MNYKITITMVILLTMCGFNCQVISANHLSKTTNSMEKVPTTPLIQIILGSTRKGRISDKIGNALKQMADKRRDISTQIIDLRDFNLPFLNDEIAPSKRKQIADPAVQRWSDTIKKADAFIIVTPEYNAGYPGVLKNALDSLYAEWHDKPIAFVGYSGGPSGGAHVLTQLRAVVAELKMNATSLEIKIPASWKAFDQQGNLADKTIEHQLNSIINQLINARVDKDTSVT